MGQYFSRSPEYYAQLPPCQTGNANIRKFSIPFVGPDPHNIAHSWIQTNCRTATQLLFCSGESFTPSITAKTTALTYFFHQRDFPENNINGVRWTDKQVEILNNHTQKHFEVPVSVLPKANEKGNNDHLEETILDYNILWVGLNGPFISLLEKFNPNHSFVNFLHFPTMISPENSPNFFDNLGNPLFFVFFIDYSQMWTLELIYGQILIPFMTYLHQYGYPDVLWTPIKQFPFLVIPHNSPVDQHVYKEDDITMLFEFFGLENVTIMQLEENNEDLFNKMNQFYYNVFFNQFCPFRHNQLITPSGSTIEHYSTAKLNRYTTRINVGSGNYFPSLHDNPNDSNIYNKVMKKDDNLWWYKDFFHCHHKLFNPLKLKHDFSSIEFAYYNYSNLESKRHKLLSFHPFRHMNHHPLLHLSLPQLFTILKSPNLHSLLPSSFEPSLFAIRYPNSLLLGFPRGNYHDIAQFTSEKVIDHDDSEINCERYYIPTISLSSRVHFIHIHYDGEFSIPEEINWSIERKLISDNISKQPSSIPLSSPWLNFQHRYNPHKEFPYYLDSFIHTTCVNRIYATDADDPNKKQPTPQPSTSSLSWAQHVLSKYRPFNETLHTPSISTYQYQTAIIPTELINKEKLCKIGKGCSIRGGGLVNGVQKNANLGTVFQFNKNDNVHNKNESINNTVYDSHDQPILFENPVLFPTSAVINNNNHIVYDQEQGFQNSSNLDLCYAFQRVQTDEFSNYIDLPVLKQNILNDNIATTNSFDKSESQLDLYKSISKTIAYNIDNNNIDNNIDIENDSIVQTDNINDKEKKNNDDIICYQQSKKNELIFQNISLQIETITHNQTPYDRVSQLECISSLPYKYTFISYIFPINLLKSALPSKRNQIYSHVRSQLDDLMGKIPYQPFPVFFVLSINDSHSLREEDMQTPIETYQISELLEETRLIPGFSDPNSEETNKNPHSESNNDNNNNQNFNTILHPDNESSELFHIRNDLLQTLTEFLSKFPKWYHWNAVQSDFGLNKWQTKYSSPLSIHDRDPDWYMSSFSAHDNRKPQEYTQNQLINQIVSHVRKRNESVFYTIICREKNLPRVCNFMIQMGLLHRLQLMAISENKCQR
jgi:hypothetical protein